MKSLYEVLVKQNIKQTETTSKYELYKRNPAPTKGIDLVYILINNVNDYINLCDQININPDPASINIINNCDKENNKILIKPNSNQEQIKIKVIFDANISNNVLKSRSSKVMSFEYIGELDSKDFNVEYWKKNKWDI